MKNKFTIVTGINEIEVGATINLTGFDLTGSKLTK